jgi:TonB family protein
MNRFSFGNCPGGLRRAAVKLFQGAALALILAMVLPARAADDRAVKSRVAPVYPEMAKRLKIDGVVKVAATVDAQGKVMDVKPISGNRMLEAAATDAVKQWRFVPGTGDATVNVEINFTLAQ